MTLAEVAAVLDEDRPQQPPVEIADARPRGPGADRVHVRDHRRAARRASRAALPARAAHPGRALARRRRGELVWCTTATGWSKSARNVVRRAVALRRRGDDRRRAGSSRRAPRADRARGRQRPLPGADRVPGAREARPSCGPSAVAAAHGLRRRGAQPGGDRGLARGDRARDLPTATARPRPGTWSATSAAPRSAPARWARRCPASSCGSRTTMLEVRVASCPTFFSRYLDGEPFAASGGRPVTSSREDAGRLPAGTRAATTT